MLKVVQEINHKSVNTRASGDRRLIIPRRVPGGFMVLLLFEVTNARGTAVARLMHGIPFCQYRPSNKRGFPLNILALLGGDLRNHMPTTHSERI